ncbi:hypothetical protein LCGC14_0044740 [marine sediment metagenome]|uniref:Competence protein CoiA-like family protein n=2 Tax=root TaxID=1 RepID=A0A7V1BIF1_9RHOB|nr:hypothetical protein [Sulfitobacter litoralis]HDZ53518.1 hypothetical protein [Sulfitobacter litoralis]
MKARFCTNTHGDLVDVKELRAEDRNARGPYTCLGCGNGMLPVLGKIRVHHFRHTSDAEIDCSHETYLHRAAKMAVVAGFTAACREGRQYKLTRNRKVRCMSAADLFPDGCSKPEAPEVFDLTQWLDTAAEEVGVGGFIADVLLTKGGEGARLLIEIEVSHPCAPEKLASGLPILETKVSSEKDIARLRTGITIDSDRGRGFNLSPLSERFVDRCSACPKEETVFIIYRSGKVQMTSQSRQRFKKILARSSIVHWEVVTDKLRGLRPVERIDAFLKAAHYEGGVNARTCLQCRYGAISNSTRQPMVCFKQRGKILPTGINKATNCLEYSPVQTYDELLQARQNRAADQPSDRDDPREDNLIED